MSSQNKTVILGAGVTGLAAGCASGLPIFEAADVPGGICSSYYMCPGKDTRFYTIPSNEETYRFEIGGGHWIWGREALVRRFIRSLTTVKQYRRQSAVYFSGQNLLIPYPIQNHLRFLGQKRAAKALSEMVTSATYHHNVLTMSDWLLANFGPTLCELFFNPFHEGYTAGLWKRIAPQDAYKSPVDLSLITMGAFDEAPQVGYNASFLYPEEGLDILAKQMAVKCNIHYGKRVARVDLKEKDIYFEDGTIIPYEVILSTLPLNRMTTMADIKIDAEPDPYISVLVTNIGAKKGSLCPKEHWVYIPESKSKFHRVGFYSNVDPSFLPASSRKADDRVSVYVERAYLGGQKPNEDEIRRLNNATIHELQQWGWIEQIEVVDSTWIEEAYTWSWPRSLWKELTLKILEDHDIYQIGRFARWSVGQGIADSIRDGLMAGATFK